MSGHCEVADGCRCEVLRTYQGGSSTALTCFASTISDQCMEYCPKGDRWPSVSDLAIAPLTLARSDTFAAADMDEPRDWLRTSSNCYIRVDEVFGNRTSPWSRSLPNVETCGPVPFLESKYHGPRPRPSDTTVISSVAPSLPLPAAPTRSPAQASSPKSSSTLALPTVTVASSPKPGTSPPSKGLALPNIPAPSTRSTLVTIPRPSTSSVVLLPLATISIPNTRSSSAPTLIPLPALPVAPKTRSPAAEVPSAISLRPLTAFSNPAKPPSTANSRFSVQPLTAFWNAGKTSSKTSSRFSVQPLTAFANLRGGTPSSHQTLALPRLTALSQPASRVPAHPSPSPEPASKFSIQPLTAFASPARGTASSKSPPQQLTALSPPASRVPAPSSSLEPVSKFSLWPLTAFLNPAKSTPSSSQILPSPPQLTAPVPPSPSSRPASKFSLQPLTAFSQA